MKKKGFIENKGHIQITQIIPTHKFMLQQEECIGTVCLLLMTVHYFINFYLI